jgi:hypothetical protein
MQLWQKLQGARDGDGKEGTLPGVQCDHGDHSRSGSEDFGGGGACSGRPAHPGDGGAVAHDGQAGAATGS